MIKQKLTITITKMISITRISLVQSKLQQFTIQYAYDGFWSIWCSISISRSWP